jgi:hypothetical protein
VGAVVGVERCNLGMQILATRVTKAENHHRWGRACGSGGGFREMQLGDASLGDDGDEGKEPSSLRAACGSGGGCREVQLGNASTSWRQG